MDDTFEQLQAALPERYTLLKEIGHGGMSTVYLAQESHPRRKVAIKVLDPGLTARLGRERFLREIDFLSNLTHPHIVPIFAAGEGAGMLFYVMPFVEGETLREHIRTKGALPLTEALRIARDIAGTLEYAHRRNVLHRDIKPDNILLHDRHPLVTDFGVARAISAAGEEAITETGLTLGTAAYMSPEQAAAREDLDGRTDIYSLGCVLYEMLAGRPPFGKGAPEQIMRRQITEPAHSLAGQRQSIPGDVDRAVLRALAKSPEERYATAAEFEVTLDRLRGVLTSGSGIRAGVVGDGTRSRWWRPVAGLLGVVAIVVLTWQLSSSRPAYPVLAEQPTHVDSLAIMPVENLTGVPALDHLAEAVTYGAISVLSKTPELKLSSYISIRAMGEQRVGPGEIVDELQVRLILASQLRVMGDTVRLTAELLDGRSGSVLERGSWVVAPGGGPSVEQGLFQALTGLVSQATKLTARQAVVEGVGGPAHEAFLLGKYWMGRRTPTGIRRALEKFREAIALDSTYAAAYEGLSTAYMVALFYRHEIGLSGYQAAGNALAAATRAIELDPSYAQAYAARGYVVSRAFGPLRDAASDFSRALQLSPNANQVVAWSGAVLAQQGRWEEALAASQRGAALGPLEPSRHLGVAVTALELGRYETAIQAARRALELEPELIEGRAFEGLALVLAGQSEECLTIEFAAHEGVRAVCLHALGREADARALVDSIARALETGTHDSLFTDVIPVADLAIYHAFAGDLQAALNWIERAYELSPRGIDHRVLESPLFDNVRGTREGRERLAEITGAVWGRVEEHAQRVPWIAGSAP